MRAHVDGGNDHVVVAADRHRDRTKMRLGLAIDQRIALLAIAAHRCEQSFWSVTVYGVSGLRCIASSARRARHRELAEHDAADRRAKRRQAIADVEAGGEHPRRAAACDEHDLLAIEHRERTDFLRGQSRCGRARVAAPSPPGSNADRRRTSVSTCGVSVNSLPSVATKPPRSSVNRMRRAVARGRSAARARSLSVIGPPVVPNYCEQAQAAIEALDESRSRALRHRCVSAWASVVPVGRAGQRLCLPSRPDMS